MSALLDFHHAQTRLGISPSMLRAAIERGDLREVEIANQSGRTRKFITADSIEAWTDRLNGVEESKPSPEDAAEKPKPNLPFPSGRVPFDMAEIAAYLATAQSLDARQVDQLRIRMSSWMLYVDRVESEVERLKASAVRHDEAQELARSRTLRHTVTARIGDSFDPHGFYVYLLWGADESTPLYIGQSRNVLGRLGSHMQDQEKRFAVKTIQLIKCQGKATMDNTERALIKEYRPPLNRAGVPSPSPEPAEETAS